MDDLQLNITATKTVNKKSTFKKSNTNSAEYKFVSKPFAGKTIARKRPHNPNGESKVNSKAFTEEPKQKSTKLSESNSKADIDINLRDLSENKGKYHGKNYQELSDDLQVKQKPRSGGWISSLFKNNPNVPRMGQRAVKPLIEKVFAGKTFADLDIHPHSVANLQQNLNLKELMTVQQKAIPVILEGRDLLIRSQTGSGKTLAYALPIVEGLQAIRPKINRHDGLKVVVVVPTRELAVQTYELFVKLVKPFTWIVPGLLSGGQKRKAEKARLRKGLSVLVGTPGRINDHLRHTQSLNFAKTCCLVLDEADRLLDMGYEKDVAAIVKAIEDHKMAATYDPMAMVKQTVVRKKFSEEEAEEEQVKETDVEQKHNLTKVFTSKERQTILLSATLTKAVENLAGITMKDPVFVDTSEGRSIIADSLKTMQNKPAQSSQDLAETITNDVIDKIDDVIEEKSDIKEEKQVEEKISMDSKRGLLPFKGSTHLDLFELGIQRSLDTKPKATKTEEDSDSDSDYEYFKVQKELENKTTSLQDSDEEVKPTKVGSVFSDAVKNAITEDELILPASVNQTFLIVPMKLRLVTLCSLIVEHCVINTKGGKMIVFVATLEMVDYLSDLIETVLAGKENKAKKKESAGKKRKKESDAASSGSDSDFEIDYQAPVEGGLVPVELDMFKLHGSMPHEDRIRVFQSFRKAKRGVLICTDVAARGVDVPKVDLVLQFCAPASATDYVHRVGRTGRAAQVGSAILCLLPSESEFVRYLESKRIRLRQADESRILEPLRHVAPGAGAAGAHKAAASVQAKLEATVQSSREWLARASRAYTSWVRFYSAYPREVREYLDGRNLHLGHAAKAFALRDTPGALAKRVKNDPNTQKQKPTNRLTVQEEEERKRPGFPRVKIGSLGGAKAKNNQSSMHSASEFDSGLEPLHTGKQKKKNKNKLPTFVST